MPKIWAETIDGHRRQVHEAILDATASLIAEHGPLSVAMTAVAERAGIGRATLYKYFPDVESIIVAWHARDVAEHVGQLAALSEDDDVTLGDIAAFVCRQRREHAHGGGAELIGAIAHNAAGGGAGGPGGAIEREIIALLTTLLARLAAGGAVRDDHEPELLARWLLHAGHAPAALDDEATARLVVDALAPPSTRAPAPVSNPSPRRHGGAG